MPEGALGRVVSFGGRQIDPDLPRVYFLSRVRRDRSAQSWSCVATLEEAEKRYFAWTSRPDAARVVLSDASGVLREWTRPELQAEA